MLEQRIEKLERLFTKMFSSKSAERTEQRTVNLSIATGNSSTQQRIILPAGKCIRTKLLITGAEPTEGVNVSIKDGSGSEIIPPSHFKDWISGNGEYFASMKHVNFQNSDVVVHVNSDVPLSANFKAQVLLFSQT